MTNIVMGETQAGIPYSGHCGDCDREVSRRMPPFERFLCNAKIRLFCAECRHPILCRKET